MDEFVSADIGSKQKCSGCTACYASCPVEAITMIEDDEGFKYPKIDFDKCVKCNVCQEVCEFRKDQTCQKYKDSKYNKPIVYAAKNLRFDIRMESRSGGVFSAISNAILEMKGVVYGCAYDSCFCPIHVRAEDMSVRDLMRGSKYAQSDLNDIFSMVKRDLDSEREVLFSGTSCQVSGLKAFLKKDYDNLLCVDIVCHGVPSPRVWNDYLAWNEKKYKSKIIKVNCRNKKEFGWKSHIETLWFDDGQKISTNIFAKLFYTNSILRPSCYACPYKDTIHPGNITLADFWGIDTVVPDFIDDYGVSMVLINDGKGAEFFGRIENTLELVSVSEDVSGLQKPLYKPYDCPDNRTTFWTVYKSGGIAKLIRRYGGYGCLAKIKKVVIETKSCLEKFFKKHD